MPAIPDELLKVWHAPFNRGDDVIKNEQGTVLLLLDNVQLFLKLGLVEPPDELFLRQPQLLVQSVETCAENDHVLKLAVVCEVFAGNEGVHKIAFSAAWYTYNHVKEAVLLKGVGHLEIVLGARHWNALNLEVALMGVLLDLHLCFLEQKKLSVRNAPAERAATIAPDLRIFSRWQRGNHWEAWIVFCYAWNRNPSPQQEHRDARGDGACIDPPLVLLRERNEQPVFFKV